MNAFLAAGFEGPYTGSINRAAAVSFKRILSAFGSSRKGRRWAPGSGRIVRCLRCPCYCGTAGCSFMSCCRPALVLQNEPGPPQETGHLCERAVVPQRRPTEAHNKSLNRGLWHRCGRNSTSVYLHTFYTRRAAGRKAPERLLHPSAIVQHVLDINTSSRGWQRSSCADWISSGALTKTRWIPHEKFRRHVDHSHGNGGNVSVPLKVHPACSRRC